MAASFQRWKSLTSSIFLLISLSSAKKIGYPQNPEYALGAVTVDGDVVTGDLTLSGVDQGWFKEELASKHEEAKRMYQAYLVGRNHPRIRGRTAIIVDDGIATGMTVRAAVKDLKRRGAKQIIIATPVIPKEVGAELAKEADQVISTLTPESFLGSVGAYYRDFPQVSDQDVLHLLQLSDQRAVAESVRF